MKRFIYSLFFLCCATFASAQESGWKQQWSQIVAAAKREGKVVVSGTPSTVVRQKLPVKFTAEFGIPVEYIGGRSSDVVARLKAERQSGLFSIDVFLSGATTPATSFYPEKMVDPVKPALILPDVVDPSKWKKGKLWFMDPEEKYVLRLFNVVSELIHVNARHVRPEEFKSIKELLNPRWKGKISVGDPTVAGTGSGIATLFYLQFGEEFVKKFYIDQKPAITRDARQMAEWVARGTYPISLGARSEEVSQFQQEGFAVETIFGLPDMPGTVSAGPAGTLVLMNKAPNPNAARVFVNWIASKGGLETYSHALLVPTTRNDIDESFLPKETIPRPGINYLDSSNWPFAITERERVRLRMQELLRH